MKTLSIAELKDLIGRDIGTSRWFDISQQRIDRFADVTQDHQWIHTQPERAASQTPFGGTIAHGFLVLSLLSVMAQDVLPAIDGSVMGINYGFDRVRFVNPVVADSRVRGHFKLIDIQHESTRNQLRVDYGVEVEIDGQDKPAIVCHWLALSVLNQPTQRAPR